MAAGVPRTEFEAPAEADPATVCQPFSCGVKFSKNVGTFASHD